MSAPTVVDTRGQACPLPVLKLRKALLAGAPGERVTLLASDPQAARDVPAFCEEAGHRLVSRDEAPAGTWRFVVERG
ncbi:MAG: response regulator SirA [Alphaproteobacteria bacterium]|nr:response regulator SirA [Alphaproteobacteria bacterium]